MRIQRSVVLLSFVLLFVAGQSSNDTAAPADDSASPVLVATGPNPDSIPVPLIASAPAGPASGSSDIINNQPASQPTLTTVQPISLESDSSPQAAITQSADSQSTPGQPQVQDVQAQPLLVSAPPPTSEQPAPTSSSSAASYQTIYPFAIQTSAQSPPPDSPSQPPAESVLPLITASSDSSSDDSSNYTYQDASPSNTSTSSDDDSDDSGDSDSSSDSQDYPYWYYYYGNGDSSSDDDDGDDDDSSGAEVNADTNTQGSSLVLTSTPIPDQPAASASASSFIVQRPNGNLRTNDNNQ